MWSELLRKSKVSKINISKDKRITLLHLSIKTLPADGSDSWLICSQFWPLLLQDISVCSLIQWEAQHLTSSVLLLFGLWIWTPFFLSLWEWSLIQKVIWMLLSDCMITLTTILHRKISMSQNLKNKDGLITVSMMFRTSAINTDQNYLTS